MTNTLFSFSDFCPDSPQHSTDSKSLISMIYDKKIKQDINNQYCQYIHQDVGQMWVFLHLPPAYNPIVSRLAQCLLTTIDNMPQLVLLSCVLNAQAKNAIVMSTTK